MASFARINDYGFIETPYRKVFKEVAADGGRDCWATRLTPTWSIRQGTR